MIWLRVCKKCAKNFFDFIRFFNVDIWRISLCIKYIFKKYVQLEPSVYNPYIPYIQKADLILFKTTYVDLLSIIYTIYYLYVVIVSWADQRTEWWRSPWPRTPGRAASSALSRGRCFGRESGRRGDPASCLSRWQPWGNTKLQTNAYTQYTCGSPNWP